MMTILYHDVVLNYWIGQLLAWTSKSRYDTNFKISRANFNSNSRNYIETCSDVGTNISLATLHLRNFILFLFASLIYYYLLAKYYQVR